MRPIRPTVPGGSLDTKAQPLSRMGEGLRFASGREEDAFYFGAEVKPVASAGPGLMLHSSVGSAAGASGL